jgi:hypothetical protein
LIFNKILIFVILLIIILEIKIKKIVNNIENENKTNEVSVRKSMDQNYNPIIKKTYVDT